MQARLMISNASQRSGTSSQLVWLQGDITEAIEGVVAQQNSLAHQMGQLQQAVAQLAEQQQQQQPQRQQQSQQYQPQQTPPQRAASKPLATLFD